VVEEKESSESVVGKFCLFFSSLPHGYKAFDDNGDTRFMTVI